MINSVVVLGRLVKDPVQRETTNDKIVTSFSIACKGYGDHVDFFNVQTWGKTAEFVSKYLKKGNQVVVDGRLCQSIWEKNGEKHYDVIIVANDVQSTGAANKEDAQTKGTQTQVLEKTVANDDTSDDFDLSMADIPF